MTFESKKTAYWALSGNNGDRGILLACEAVQLLNLDASAKGSGSSSPFGLRRTGVLLDETVLLEAMCVDVKSTEAGGSTHEIMTGVADDKAQVVDSCKVNAGLDVLPGLRENNVVANKTESAVVVRTRGERGTGLVRPVGPHASHRVVGAE